MTSELADFLLHCRAKRIVVLLNTCWSGNGGQELASAISGPVSESPPEEQTRSMAIISSARSEEALDGAFIPTMLAILKKSVPPPTLPEEHRWPESACTLPPDSLFAAVNVLLKEFDHQSQIKTAYGIVGKFFHLENTESEPPELPPGLIKRLRRDFPGQLSAMKAPWNEDRVKAEGKRCGGMQDSEELAHRLNRLALGLSAFNFLGTWIGRDAGLANHLPPAWQATLPPIHRIPRPKERFGYIEQIVLHSSDEQIVEFIARVIVDAGGDPKDNRLYKWAQENLEVDSQIVDDALHKVSSSSAVDRLIINFGLNIADDAEDDALPESVFAWIHRPDGTCSETRELRFNPPHDVAEMVGHLTRWALQEGNIINQVDVILPVSLFCSPTRPEAARIKLKRNLSKPVTEYSGIIVRWSERISDSIARSDGIEKGREIAEGDEVRWIERGEHADNLEFYSSGTRGPQAVAFSYEPEGLDAFYAAAYSSPYILWIDEKCEDPTGLRKLIDQHWHNLPRLLKKEYCSPEPSTIRSAHIVWDDPEWLEKIVPCLPEFNYPLSFQCKEPT